MTHDQDTITISLPQQQADQRAEIERGSTWATTLVIDTPDKRAEAGRGLQGLKKVRKNIALFFADAKTAAHAAHRAICEAENKMGKPIDDAIEAVTAKAIAYDTEQERIRKEAERKAIEAAEAERRRLEAIAARCKNEEKREAYIEAAQAVEVAPIVPEVPKVDGEIRAKVWQAELVNMRSLCEAAAAGDANAISVITFNQAAANRLAGIHKRPDVIPGVKFSETIRLSHRTK